MTRRTLFLGIGAALTALYLGAGMVWTVLNLGDVPHYGDTKAFLWLAKARSVDEYRGFAYPALLAATDRWCPGPALPRGVRWEDQAGNAELPCAAPSKLIAVQVFQVIVAALCLAYFVHVVMGSRSGLSRAGLVLLWLLMLFDPLLDHFNLAAMTDGLACSLSLAFCAALADLACRRTPPWLAGAVLVVSYVLTAGLRIEKKWVLLGTLLGTVAIWTVVRRRRGQSAPFRFPRAAALALGALGIAAVTAVSMASTRSTVNWSTAERMVHHRLIFPHLASVYDELPEETRALLAPGPAKSYGRNLGKYRKVIHQATAGRPGLRERLTRDLARSVLRLRWRTIAAGLARDLVENVFATASYHGRLVTWNLGGEAAFFKVFGPDGTIWIFERLTMHHPRASRIYLWSSAALLALSTVLAAAALRRFIRRRAWPGDPGLVVLWSPAVLFCLWNAVAFALVQDLVQIRYTLVSHAIFLGLVYTVWIGHFPLATRKEGNEPLEEPLS